MSFEEDRIEGEASSVWEGLSSKAIWNEPIFSAAVQARDGLLVQSYLRQLDPTILAELQAHLELKSAREKNAARAMLSSWIQFYSRRSAMRNTSGDKYSFVLGLIQSLPKS